MKYLLLIAVLMTGCTTVYKVDEKGICRDTKGKVVNVRDVEPDKIVKRMGGVGHCGCGSMFGFVVRLEQLNTGGTAYGW